MQSYVAAMGLNELRLSVRQLFVEASPTVEKAASCYKADRLVASLLSFCSVQSSLAVCEFHAAVEDSCKRGHRWGYAILCCVYLQIHCDNLAWWAVTQRTLKNHKTQNWGRALARVWALAWDNTVSACANSEYQALFSKFSNRSWNEAKSCSHLPSIIQLKSWSGAWE